MITIQVSLQDQTVAAVIAAATQQGLSFDEYIDQRLGSAEATTMAYDFGSTDPVDALAETLFDAATRQDPNRQMFLVEDLYKELNLDVEWESRSPGNRIKLGKAFKRVVEKHLREPAVPRPDGAKVRVIAHDKKTSQNQQLYFTELESTT